MFKPYLFKRTKVDQKFSEKFNVKLQLQENGSWFLYNFPDSRFNSLLKQMLNILFKNNFEYFKLIVKDENVFTFESIPENLKFNDSKNMQLFRLCESKDS